jgi:hypothetical protein
LKLFCEETFKENIKRALAKSNGNIDYKDLSSFFENVQTDNDLDLFLEAMKRYQIHQTELDPRLSVPLMQLLYVSNRTNKALELTGYNMSQVALIL